MCTKELIELGLWLSSDDESRVELERQRLSLQSSIQQQENRFMHELEERRSFPAQLEKLQTRLHFLRCDVDFSSEVFSSASSVSLIPEEGVIDSVIADYASLVSRLQDWERAASELFLQAQDNYRFSRSGVFASRTPESMQQEELVEHQLVGSVLTRIVLQVAVNHEICALTELRTEFDNIQTMNSSADDLPSGLLRREPERLRISDSDRQRSEQVLHQQALQATHLRSILTSLQLEEESCSGAFDRASLKAQYDSMACVIATWQAQKEALESQLHTLRTACDARQAEIEQELVATVDAQTASAVASSGCKALELDRQSLHLREAACNFGCKAENLCMDVEDTVARIVRLLDSNNTLLEQHTQFRMCMVEWLLQFTMEELNLLADLAFARKVCACQAQRLAALSTCRSGGKSRVSSRGQLRLRTTVQQPAARTVRKACKTRKLLSSLATLRAEYSKVSRTLSALQERVRASEAENKRMAIWRYRALAVQQLHSRVSSEWRAKVRATEGALLQKDKKFQKDMQSRGQQLQADCSRARRERNALMQKIRNIER